MMGAVGVVTAVGQNVLLGKAFAQTGAVSASSLDPTPMFYESILGYGTHGDFYVMDGTPIESGYEFPLR